MAGGSSMDGDDNPVSINVVPMVDVIFCLCVFFFCSFHFKQIEGRIQSWLPKDKGIFEGQVANPMMEEVRVFVKFNEAAGTTSFSVGPTTVDPNGLTTKVRSEYDSVVRSSGKSEVPVIIDGEKKVPWRDIIIAMDMIKAAGINKIEFASPVGYTLKQ